MAAGARFCSQCGSPVQASATAPPAPTGTVGRSASAEAQRAAERAGGPAAGPTSFSEKYAGTIYGRPVEALAPAAPPATAASTGPSLLRILVVVVGLIWILPQVVGLVTLAYIDLVGLNIGDTRLDADTLHAALSGDSLWPLSLLVTFLWIALGLKLIFAPGRTSLGCSTGLGFLGLLGCGLGLLAARQLAPPGDSLIWLFGAGLGLYLFITGVSYIARSSWD